MAKAKAKVQAKSVLPLDEYLKKLKELPDIKGSSFQDREIDFAVFHQGQFEHTDFSNSKFFSNFLLDGHFDQCKMEEVKWEDCSLNKSSFQDCTFTKGFLNADFSGSGFVNCQFQLMVLEFCEFNGAVWDNVTFKDCNFEGCVFSYCRFESCVFDNCRFLDSHFEGACFDFCKFTGNGLLKQVTFNGATFLGTLFTDYELNQVKFNGSEFVGPTIQFANEEELNRFEKCFYVKCSFDGCDISSLQIRDLTPEERTMFE